MDMYRSLDRGGGQKKYRNVDCTSGTAITIKHMKLAENPACQRVLYNFHIIATI